MLLPCRPQGCCLELVCADFLAGRTEESTPEEILMLIHHLAKLLPPEYQARLAGQEREEGFETAARPRRARRASLNRADWLKQACLGASKSAVRKQ